MEKEPIKKPKLLDVSGYNYTGKAAIIDTLKEFSSTHVYHPKDIEFALIRMSGGLLDLHQNVYANWSPIRADIAIKRFRSLIKVLASAKTSFLNPLSLFSPTGQNYNVILGKEFETISNEYINLISTGRYKTYWPFPDFYAGPFRSIFIKILNILDKYNNEYEPAYNSNFCSITSDYLDKVLTLQQKKAELIVTSNALEVFDPMTSLDLFENYKLIRVDRNPIDSYLSSIRHLTLSEKEHESRIGEFIERYDKYHQISNRHFHGHPRCLDIAFEEYVLDYPAELKKIIKFADLNKEDHSDKYKFFSPSLNKINLLKEFKFPHLFRDYPEILSDYKNKVGK